MTNTYRGKVIWRRVRFKASLNDYRPVRFPPPGPYWCTGHGDDYSTIVAFVSKLSQVEDYWPEAHEVELLSTHDEITFDPRFPKPDWWEGPRK